MRLKGEEQFLFERRWTQGPKDGVQPLQEKQEKENGDTH